MVNQGGHVSDKVGLFSASVLVVANMIGTGIFTTSGLIMEELGNPLTLLLCWLLGGVFALSGALCYGELGAMYPRAGGEYIYLRRSFGRWPAFLSGWISLIVGFSAPIAAAAIAFASYFFRALPGYDIVASTDPLVKSGVLIINPVTLLAVFVIVLSSIIHYRSLIAGSRFQNILTVFKIALVIGFCIAGLAPGGGTLRRFEAPFEISSILSEEFAVSLIYVCFAYSGWNAAAYIGGEIRYPQKNIPLALLGGTLFVMVLYLLLNALYIYALSLDEMSGAVEVGAEAAMSLFGEQVGHYVSAAVALCLLSVISAMILAGPRVYYAMAADGMFFKIFGKLRPVRGTPSYSILLQGGISTVMVLTASFSKLLLYIGFTIALFSMLTVIGLIRLRMTGHDLLRPYRTLGYPFTPLLFIVGNLWIVYFAIRSRPVVCLLGVGTIVVGSLVYLLFRAVAPGRPGGSGQ